jgi:uncharacterized membrane protein
MDNGEKGVANAQGVCMLYAVLKAIHLLSLVAWVGGMFFVLVCLRPALVTLEGPLRLRLMNEVLRRFFTVVGVAVGLMLVSGAWMLWLAFRAATAPGLKFNMPIDWHVMIGLGLAMIAIFGHVRAVLFKRLQLAVQAQDAAAGAAVLAQIRRWVMVNLVMGAIVVVVMKLGAAA